MGPLWEGSVELVELITSIDYSCNTDNEESNQFNISFVYQDIHKLQ